MMPVTLLSFSSQYTKPMDEVLKEVLGKGRTSEYVSCLCEAGVDVLTFLSESEA